MLRKLFFISFISLATLAQANYVVFKFDGKNYDILSEKEFMSVEPILRKTFPAILHPDYQFDKKLLEAIAKDEQGYVQQEIAKIDPQFKLFFIPGTVYALGALPIITQWNIDYMVNIHLKKPPHGRVFDNYLLGSLDFFNEQLNQYNELEYQIHTFITGFILKRTTAEMFTSLEKVEPEFFTVLGKEFQQYAEREKLRAYEQKSIAHDLLARLIVEECKAHKKNQFLLFRSSMMAKDSTLYSDDFATQNYSLSFTVNIFSGIWADPHASPLFLVTYHDDRKFRDFYAVAINKTDYLNKKSIAHQLFYVPWLPTFLTFLAEGEWYHARTKLAQNQPFDPPTQLGKISFRGMEMGHQDSWLRPALISTFSTQKKLEAAFQKYLKNNAILLHAGKRPIASKL